MNKRQTAAIIAADQTALDRAHAVREQYGEEAFRRYNSAVIEANGAARDLELATDGYETLTKAQAQERIARLEEWIAYLA